MLIHIFLIFNPICLCCRLAARWSPAPVVCRLAAEAGERVPSALSCFYKTAVRLRARTFACVSYPLSIDFPPFVLSTGAWVLPRVRLVNFHDFFLCFKSRSPYEAALHRFVICVVSWPIVFVHFNTRCCETVFHWLFIVVASSLRNVFAFKLLLKYIFWRIVIVGKNRGAIISIMRWFLMVYSKGNYNSWNVE